jgi:hypothetical protein
MAILRNDSITLSAAASLHETGLGMGATAANPYTPGHWTQSLLLRASLALLFTAGMTFVLRRLTDALLIALNFDAEKYWRSLAGFMTWQPEQMAALIVGTMLACAGRCNCLGLGILIGLLAGFLSVIGFGDNPNVPLMLWIMLPLWHAVGGAVGAKIGEAIWHPPVQKPQGPVMPVAAQEARSLAQNVRQAISGLVFAHLRWWRILLACVVVLTSLWYMGDLLSWLIRALHLNPEVMQTGLQKGLLLMMLKVAAVGIAAAMAGATTSHGIAHGFWVGVISGVMNLLHYVWFEESIDVITILSEIGWVWLLCIVAGGFGAHLMPPLAYLAEKRRVNPSNVSVPLE